MADAAFLRIEGVSKTFGAFQAVRDVTLSVAQGEIFALLGGSGCGKTTLLRMLAGFEEPTAGRIFLDGKDMAGVPPWLRPVHMMFQSYALFPHMTVEANVAYGLKHEPMTKPARAERVREMLDLVQLTPFAKRKPHQISGGQRQRVALARALARHPKLLLLDEPLAALDKKLREHTQFELMSIQERTGVTFIVVTHDQEEAMTLADRIAVLRDGRLEQAGSPAELYERPNSIFVAGFIGSPKMNFLTGKFAEAENCTTLGVRSEHIEVVPDGPWSGEVLHVEDLGSDHYLFVEIGSDEPVIVRRPGKATVEVGTRVSIAPQAGHLYRFDAEGKPLR